MTEQEREQYKKYALSFTEPAELSFITPEMKKLFEAEKKKMQETEKFIKTVIETDNFEDTINKAIAEGKIYSPSQYANLEAKFSALEEKDGNRIDLQESIISKTGQRIIMSGGLQERLDFISDGWVLKDELDELVSALQADHVPGPEIDRVVAAMNKYGAIVMQRGVFINLKAILDEAIGRNISIYNAAKDDSYINPDQSKPAGPSIVSTPPQTAGELPLGFIEFLKNNDKEYDRVEHEISKDEKFQEFFASLKQHYKYYQELPEEKMIAEIIIRPQLWIKLSPETKPWVQTIVERNKHKFLEKISEVAKNTHADKLEQLKQTLGK